ncbi:MAG: hypothetical protein AB7S81_06765 [Bdellovibrionales bacterium]
MSDSKPQTETLGAQTINTAAPQICDLHEKLGIHEAKAINTLAKINPDAARAKVHQVVEQGHQIATTDYGSAFLYFEALSRTINVNLPKIKQEPHPDNWQIKDIPPAKRFAEAARCCFTCSSLFGDSILPGWQTYVLDDFQQDIKKSFTSGEVPSAIRFLIPWLDRYIQASWKNPKLTKKQNNQNRGAVGQVLSYALKNREQYFSGNFWDSLYILPSFTRLFVDLAAERERDNWFNLFVGQTQKEATVMTEWFNEKEGSKPSEEQFSLLVMGLRNIHTELENKERDPGAIEAQRMALIEAAAAHYPDKVQELTTPPPPPNNPFDKQAYELDQEVQAVIAERKWEEAPKPSPLPVRRALTTLVNR